MSTDECAVAIVAACGGAGNIALAEQCFTRLRLQVHELGAVDFAVLEAIVAVRMAFEQAGEVHLLLTTPLRETVAAVSALLA